MRDLAKVAYEGYYQFTMRLELPGVEPRFTEWEALPAVVQGAWNAATAALVRDIKEHLAEH